MEYCQDKSSTGQPLPSGADEILAGVCVHAVAGRAKPIGNRIPAIRPPNHAADSGKLRQAPRRNSRINPEVTLVRNIIPQIEVPCEMKEPDLLRDKIPVQNYHV